MSKQDYTSEHGPSWVDVENYIDEMELKHDVRITLKIERHTMKGGARRTLVAIEARNPANYPYGLVKCAKHVWWERREFKTITALWYNLLFNRDQYLHDMREAAEEQQPLL